MAELKPCPFCGKEPSTGVFESDIERPGLVATVICDCGIKRGIYFRSGTFDVYQKAFSDAIELWNRRATDGN